MDGKPHDNVISRHELFPVRAPLATLEHCIGDFLDQCDQNDDHGISLEVSFYEIFAIFYLFHYLLQNSGGKDTPKWFRVTIVPWEEMGLSIAVDPWT